MRALFQRRRHERDLDDELLAWLSLEEQRHLALGSSPQEARHLAELALGGREQVKEKVRSAWRGQAFFDLLRDLHFGLRSLRRKPSYAVVVILTLALGIGANAAIFSMVHGVLIRPLPYPDPGRLALVWFSYDGSEQGRIPASGPELVDLRERTKLFEGLAGIWSSTGALTGEGDPQQLRVGFVTANFFDVLGTAPSLGRSFLGREEGQGENGIQAVILADSLWRNRFGSDPSILGRDIQFDGWPATVVGVMPPGFELQLPPDAGVPTEIDAWLAFPWNVRASPREQSFLRILGRLEPGVTTAQAREEAASLASTLRGEHARYQELGLGLHVVNLQDDAVRHLGPALKALFGGVLLLLLIACINIAHLQVGRFSLRRREIALRATLGASRLRIARQLLVENLALAFLGGTAGVVLGSVALELFSTLLPPGLEGLGSIGLSWPVILYSFLLTLLTAVLSSLVPLLASSDVRNLQPRGTPGAPARGRLPGALVAGEFAMGCLLLIAAGLLLRTLAHTLESDPGFRPVGALSFQVSLPDSRYPDDSARAAAAVQIRDSLARLPGVTGVGAASHLPLDDYPNWYGFVWREGAAEAERSSVMADQRAVTAGYLEALGATLKAGRLITEGDRASQRPVAVVDETLARRLWPGRSALGQRLHLEGYDNGRFVPRQPEVVGVVGHVHHHDLLSRLRGQVFLPHQQNARPVLTWVLRTEGDPTRSIQMIGREIEAIDPELPMAKVRPLTYYVGRAAAAAGFTAALSAGFAIAALLLAAIGAYGVAANSVAQRTHEIGVRLALGARWEEILRAVVGRALVLAAIGLVIGLLASLSLVPVLKNLIHGVSLGDPMTYGAVVFVLLATAGLASFFPALRAARIDPVRCLRGD